MSHLIGRLNLRSKLALLFILFSSLPLLAMTYLSYSTLEQYFLDTTLKRLRGLARTKVSAIEQFGVDRLRNVEQVATLPDIVFKVGVILPYERLLTPESQTKKDGDSLEKKGGKLPESVVEVKEEEEIEKEKKTRRKKRKKAEASVPKSAMEARLALRQTLSLILRDQKEYEELLLIGRDGHVLVSSFEENEGKDAKGIEYFEKGLKATYFQHVFVSKITEKLTMVVATPIKDQEAKAIGVLAARLNLDRFFQLIKEQEGLGESGETVVAKVIDTDAVFMAPTRHDHKGALQRKVQLGSSQSRPLQEAARGQRGSGTFDDYRGIRSYMAWEYIPILDWGLVVKIDEEEASNPFIKSQFKILFLTVIILVVSFLLASLISKTIVQPLVQLKDATDKISKGDLNVKLDIRSSDEVGELADSFSRMIAALRFFKEEEKNKE